MKRYTLSVLAFCGPLALVACGGRMDGPYVDGGVVGERDALAASILAGRSFRIKVIEIGGYAPGGAPTNDCEVVQGDLTKICFGNDSTVVACQCTTPLVPSVSDIQPGGHPTTTCQGPLVCGTGSYGFNEQGELRIWGFPDPTSLLWPISPDNAGYTNDYPSAGTVLSTVNGIYVNDLYGLGQALLAPIAGCSP